MPRTSVDDVFAFLAVARERRFTRAAAKLGVSQSALSQTVRSLEARLGLRLLARTTRSVAPTAAGERLIQAIGPHVEGIEVGLAALTDLRERPTGTVRITADENAVRSVLWPALQDQILAHVEAGRLVRVLADWYPPFSGYHLYYPSRRQHAPAFAVLIDALRKSRMSDTCRDVRRG